MMMEPDSSTGIIAAAAVIGLVNGDAEDRVAPQRGTAAPHRP